jgi:hypothetical protein
MNCPDCDTIITVPRIQINDATDEKAPKRPNQPKRKDSDRPPKLPSRCPESPIRTADPILVSQRDSAATNFVFGSPGEKDNLLAADKKDFDLRSTEIQKREYGWEKPEWANRQRHDFDLQKVEMIQRRKIEWEKPVWTRKSFRRSSNMF